MFDDERSASILSRTLPRQPSQLEMCRGRGNTTRPVPHALHPVFYLKSILGENETVKRTDSGLGGQMGGWDPAVVDLPSTTRTEGGPIQQAGMRRARQKKSVGWTR